MRIQNRNTGYSDFTNTGSSQSFTFSNPNNSIITHGANALKLEEEVKSENLETSQTNGAEMSDISSVSNEQSDSLDEATNSVVNSIEENEIQTSPSNGLENFDINEEETPELFNEDNNENIEDTLSSIESNNNDKEEDDDLEIPAFLRRQKN